MILDLVATADTILFRAIACVALGSGLMAGAGVAAFAVIRARITARRTPTSANDDYQEAA